LFGAEHPDTLATMDNLARTYHKQEKWNEAKQLELAIINIRKTSERH
jgi:hypothetical protein